MKNGKTLLLFLACCSASAATHIHATLLLHDGVTPMAGKISVYGPSGSSGLAATSQTVAIGDGGVVDFWLVGCPGCAYLARYQLVNSAGIVFQNFEEKWIVPNSVATMTIDQLWGGSAAPLYLVSPQQINPAGLSVGQTWVWDGNSFVPGTGGGGGGGDGTWGGGAGSVTTWGGN
jgi:hypothetical protein